MSRAASELRVERPLPGVTRLVLDRPERRNAIGPRLLAELTAAFEALEDPVVVLASADPAAFCAGADLSRSLRAGARSHRRRSLPEV